VNGAEQAARQRAFYESRDHEHLRVRSDDFYAEKLARKLARTLGIQPGHRVLEVGAGFGRFTFPLLQHCASITALDMSSLLLDELAAERERRNIPERRLPLLCGDVNAFELDTAEGPFDFVVGFFFLHHLPDYRETIERLAPLVASGGRMAFVEPNRRNPLFLVQVLACPDMTWREEKGMFLLRQRGVEAAFQSAGLAPRTTHRFGFFPPQIFNRFAFARRIEARLERIAPLRWVLPFLLLSALAEDDSRRAP
jgi:2-polyprenyl-3-methyl-5-hydroxy-6-metoxy-1,4-benzoquinol methylase